MDRLSFVELSAHPVSDPGGHAPIHAARSCEQVLADFGKAGIDLGKLAEDLQSQGARSFDDSWHKMLNAIQTKSKNLQEVP